MPTCQAIQATTSTTPLPASIQQVIQQFADIFNEPTHLPHSRVCFDHKISLRAGTETFNLRPYRYSIVQKNIIDQLVQDMMEQGIIQHSSSPFASPTVLVRKKDGSWRLCVDRSLSAREDAIKLLIFHLLRAQNRMKQQADKHRSDRQFSVGDYVFLKLHPYKQHFMRKTQFHKLLPKYYGPFKVVDKMGAAAYQLELPKDAAIHNVFHVSQLKVCHDPTAAIVHNIPGFMSQPPTRVPERILERKMVKRGRVAATKVLVQWKDTPPDMAT
ncbi:hypothetical protein L195_g054307, partial [Trifolium pratense]